MQLTFKSEFGMIKISGCERYIRSVEIVKEDNNIDGKNLPEHFFKAQTQLREFFSGERKEFDLPLKPEGTEFQLAVWNEMLKIPYGETVSYGEIGQRIQRPKAYQAIGAACGKNPIPFIIPCHRVVAANGIGGFSLGLQSKENLLNLESCSN